MINFTIKMSKDQKLNSFMVLKDSCNQLIIDLNDDQAEFLSLIDKVSAFDREHLQGSFTKLEAKFEQLEQEFTRIARSITQDQHSTCTNFLTEVRNKITPLKKEIKTCCKFSRSGKYFIFVVLNHNHILVPS